MKEGFPTVDITRLTHQEKVLAMVGQGARPGAPCESSPGYVKEEEAEAIAARLGVSLEKAKEAFLREVRAYNKKLYKPKHEPKEIRLGDRRTGARHIAPYGRCVFLDKEQPDKHACMLGESMPLHCKVSAQGEHSHKLHVWYLLNHVVDAEDPRSLREWAIYLKTHPTIPGGRLEDLVPDADRLRRILEAEDYHIEVEDNQ